MTWLNVPKPGDKCTFTGCLIVVPDVSQLALPGSKLEPGSDRKGGNRSGVNDGVTGAKALGARELTYKLSFLACMVETTVTNTGNICTGGMQAEMKNPWLKSTEILEEYSPQLNWKKLSGFVQPATVQSLN